MFEERFMGFGGFHGNFNTGQRAPEPHRLLPPPDLASSGGFPQNLNANSFLKSQCVDKISSGDALDLCRKLNKMGISCDMSIWSSRPEPFRVDPEDFGSRRRRTLHGFSGFDQNPSAGFLQNATSRGVSPAELRFLAFQDSVNPGGFREMMALKSQRDFLLDHMNRPVKLPSPCLRAVSLENDALMMFEGNRASRALAAMEVSGASSYPEDSLGGVSFVNDPLMIERESFSRALAAMEGHGASYPEEDSLIGQGSYRKKMSLMKNNNGLPLNLASMVNIYGSVNLMAKDQIGCRVLQKLLDEGTFHDSVFIFLETINHVVELSVDQFGNYFVQKLLDVCDEEQRRMIVNVLTSKPMELTKICLNTYGTRVVQKMIETVKTKQQIGMVKSGLKPGFLALVKDLNGNHVIQTCLNSLGPNDNKFVLEAATKYCSEIATHRHGCCVLQCCISNSVGEHRERLVNEISKNSLHLSQDPYGNYVVQYLIEQNVSAVKLLIQFRMHYAELATQKFSSHVMEKCLRRYPESRAEIVRELLSVPNFEHLLQDPYGNYVIQTALSVTKGPVRESLVDKVHRYGTLRSSPYCKKIFSKTLLKK